MIYLPFPPELAKESAEKAEKQLASSKPQTSHSYRGLCFRRPDGAVIPVYDPYQPEYPEGCEPGTGTIRATWSYYPQGYSFSVTEFQSL